MLKYKLLAKMKKGRHSTTILIILTFIIIITIINPSPLMLRPNSSSVCRGR